MTEEIKDIPFAQGYMVSNLGNVYSKWYGSKSTIKIHDDIQTRLKTQTVRGYPRVGLVINKKLKHFLVNRLVALVFVPNPKNYEIVMPIDENKLNNRADNLCWGTKAMANHRVEARTGGKHHRNKYTKQAK